MSPETLERSEKKSLQWVQLDSKEFLEKQAQLLEALSTLIDISLSTATQLQRSRRFLLEQALPDLEKI